MDDAAGAVDDDAGAPVVQARADRGFQVATLCTDAGHQNGHAAHDATHRLELGRVGRSDHQRAVAVLVPSRGDGVGDVLVQWDLGLDGVFRLEAHGQTQLHHVGDLRPHRVDGDVLELARSRVGGLAQEDAAQAAVQERTVGLLAQVGVEGDGVDAEPLEHGHVALVGAADVAALGVGDDHHLRKVRLDEAADGVQRLEPLAIERFVERQVRLERQGALTTGSQDALAERLDTLVGKPLDVRGDSSQTWVEPHTDELGLLPAKLQLLNEPHDELLCRPPQLNRAVRIRKQGPVTLFSLLFKGFWNHFFCISCHKPLESCLYKPVLWLKGEHGLYCLNRAAQISFCFIDRC